MSKEVQVEIYGQLHAVGGALDPAYVRQLAHTVDSKMHALAQHSDIVDTRRLAVLVALNLADELQQLKEKKQQETGGLPPEFAHRLEHCNRLLEGALSSKTSE